MGSMPEAPWALVHCLKDPNMPLNSIFIVNVCTQIMLVRSLRRCHFLTLYHHTHFRLNLLMIHSIKTK